MQMKTDRTYIKRIVRLLLNSLLLSSLLLNSSCDNIAEEERLIYEAPPTVNRSVLIEDFTGQRCVNCPNAADEIHSLQQEYGEDVIIAVGIHGGPMAVYPNPGKGIVGLATETGDNYNTYWKVEQWPMGMVNRGGVSPYTNWKGLVREELQKTAPVAIIVSGEWKVDSGKCPLSVTVEGREGNVNGKLQVWIIEDDITAIQLMPDGKANADYIHQHVFRAAVNGEWGEDLSVKETESVSKHYDVSLQADWNPDNLSIVAFVYNEQGVLQVTRSRLRND